MYTITNYVTFTSYTTVYVHEYGGKTKFGAKNEDLAKVVNGTTWRFCDLLQN